MGEYYSNHGTHVATIIAGKDRAPDWVGHNGGVAPKANIYNYAVFYSSWGTSDAWWISDAAEYTAFLTFIDANSLATPALALTAAGSSEQSLLEITQRVQELVIKMNTPNFRTFNAFAILPYKNAASISALSNYVRGEDAEEKRLIINKMGKTTYYVNPEATATTMYVGLHDTGKSSMGASSIIMGTFPQQLLRATEGESFQGKIGLLNRYATAVNPLSDSGSEMLMSAVIS